MRVDDPWQSVSIEVVACLGSSTTPGKGQAFDWMAVCCGAMLGFTDSSGDSASSPRRMKR